MESTHVISIPNNNGEKVAHMENIEKKIFQFPLLSPFISRFRENKMHCSLVPITSYVKDKKKSKYDTRKMIHSIKVGMSLVLVSLLFLLDPLYKHVGENAMWAIMTVVVLFEFSAGATLGKGLNRGMGTMAGGGIGCLSAFLAQEVGGVGNPTIIATSVFIFGTAATYLRQIPSVKKRYDYGVMIFLLTFSLVAVSAARVEEVWEIARQRLLTILVGFIICISVCILIFPFWASDELHHSIASRFQDLANTVQGCLEEYVKFDSETQNQPSAVFSACKSMLNSKSKDESLANFARWEPWHGKFGFSYPWDKYIKIGERLGDLGAIIISLGGCLQSPRLPMASVRQSVQEPLEAIGSSLGWTLRELADSIKQMRKFKAEPHILPKLKAVRVELCFLLSPSKISEDNSIAIASFVMLLSQVLEKVEELTKEVEELGQLAGFHTH